MVDGGGWKKLLRQGIIILFDGFTRLQWYQQHQGHLLFTANISKISKVLTLQGLKDIKFLDCIGH